MENLIDIKKAGFFVTGNECIREGLDLKYIPRIYADNIIAVGGACLAGYNQDLARSFSVAKNILEQVERGEIKFVLIGLSPVQAVEEKVLDDYFKLCIENGAKPVAVVFPVKQSVRKTYKADVVKTFRDTINKVAKKYKASFIDLLDVKLADKNFKDNANLTSDGAASISSLLGARLYLAKIFSAGNVLEMPAEFFNVLEKNFAGDYKKLIPHLFCRTACDDFKRLSETLNKDTCLDLMAQIFSVRTYDYLVNLSNMLPKDDYNELAERIFKISAEKISRKDKIKVGFVTYDSSMWSGDYLYNFFTQNERFEPTIFLCLRTDKPKDELVKKNFLHGVEQFKSRNFNVIGLDNRNAAVPPQDVLILLTPYFGVLPLAFRPENISLKTLLAYIPYAFETAHFNTANNALSRTAWKIFFPSNLTLEIYKKISNIDMPQGFYSGFPRLDIFFKKDAKFHFDWKMTRPDAKKIIYAPHWSINRAVKYATFQWNYQFMYDFAKNHPEISWVFKPHPNLLFSAVSAKVFPSADAFKEYIRKWDELPNAQVYTGAYYQEIFATSDGMILDSGSFMVEYQYMHKPIIFLNREGKKLNKLGEEIMKVLYLVDGKDLDAIAANMQKIFIEGDDYKFAEREKFFDKYLNYPKANGMLASEFIYKSIADGLKGDI